MWAYVYHRCAAKKKEKKKKKKVKRGKKAIGNEGEGVVMCELHRLQASVF